MAGASPATTDTQILSVLSDPNLESFVVNAEGLPWTIPAGESKTFTVSFAPTSSGVKEASVSVVHNADGSPASVALSGTGVIPSDFEIDPVSHNFGNIDVGESSEAKEFTIRNSGDTMLMITEISLSGDINDFELIRESMPWGLPGGTHESFTVRFIPTSAGVKTAGIVIKHNAYENAEFIVAVSGTAVAVNEWDDVVDVRMTGLRGNWPNPFNPVTSIRYTVGASQGTSSGVKLASQNRSGFVDRGIGGGVCNTPVQITVYNTRGQHVKTLVDGVFEPGEYTVTWNGTDETGKPVSSGVYFYRMVADGYTETRRMVLMK